MKVEELRIGNKIICALNEELRLPDGIPRTVSAILPFGEVVVDLFAISANTIKCPIIRCSGIPISEDWFIKFGFGKYDETHWMLPEYHSYEIGINEPLRLFLPAEIKDESDYYTVKDNNCKIKYVHQLQNLYFALTGEDLKIKE